MSLNSLKVWFIQEKREPKKCQKRMREWLVIICSCDNRNDAKSDNINAFTLLGYVN